MAASECRIENSLMIQRLNRMEYSIERHVREGLLSEASALEYQRMVDAVAANYGLKMLTVGEIPRPQAHARTRAAAVESGK